MLAEHTIEELQAAPLSRLGPGLAFDLCHGPVGRGLEAQLRPGFGDVGDDGNTQHGKVDCLRQLLAAEGRRVRVGGGVRWAVRETRGRKMAPACAGSWPLGAGASVPLASRKAINPER